MSTRKDSEIQRTHLDNTSLFHASRLKYEIGSVIEADVEVNTTYLSAINRGLQWLEEDFEKGKPEGLPSRKNCRFAFHRISDCLEFMKSDNRIRQGYKSSDHSFSIYEVEVKVYYKAPMSLVSFAMKRRGESTYYDIIQEYWEPQNQWKCWEYLTNEMQIATKVNPSTYPKRGSILIDIADDIDAANRIWPV